MIKKRNQENAKILEISFVLVDPSDSIMGLTLK